MQKGFNIANFVCMYRSTTNSWPGGEENRSTYFPLSKFNDNASVIQNNLFRNRLKTLSKFLSYSPCFIYSLSSPVSCNIYIYLIKHYKLLLSLFFT